MGILEQYKEQAKKNIKVGLEYKGTFEEAKSISKKNATKEGVAIDKSVSKSEFEKRYNGIRFVLFLNIGFILFFTYQMFSGSTILFSLFSFISILIAGIIYFKTSFTAWRARYVYNRWEQRNESIPLYFSDYINEVELNWKEALPINIKNKRGKENA